MTFKCTGLDGANPLAFFAALGVLRILDAQAQKQGNPTPRLSWVDEGRWRPCFYGPQSLQDIVNAVLIDMPSWDEGLILGFAYTSGGERTTPDAAGAIRDLKPTPVLARNWLEEIAEQAAAGNRGCADTVAALVTDTAVDGKGNTKPSTFHFTAGKQLFLKMVGELRQGLKQEDFVEALCGPWRGRSKLPSLSWDSTVARIYALRASDPSDEKRGSIPGADWLAFNGLALLPVVPRGKKILTTGVTGGWKNGVFTWPVWRVPATLRSIRSLLSWHAIAPPLQEDRNNTWREQLRIRGVAAVFRSAITRSEQGGYGGFSPAEVVWAGIEGPGDEGELPVYPADVPNSERTQPVDLAPNTPFWDFD